MPNSVSIIGWLDFFSWTYKGEKNVVWLEKMWQLYKPKVRVGRLRAPAQWPIDYGASDFGSNGPRFESGRGRCVESLDKALYLPLSQGEAFTLASISYLAILVKYILYWQILKVARDSFGSNKMCQNLLFMAQADIAVTVLHFSENGSEHCYFLIKYGVNGKTVTCLPLGSNFDNF